jgi:hypothetical protein
MWETSVCVGLQLCLGEVGRTRFDGPTATMAEKLGDQKGDRSFSGERWQHMGVRQPGAWNPLGQHAWREGFLH